MPEPRAEGRAQELLERGASLYEEGRLYEALSCWKQVLQIDPENEIAGEYLRFIEENFQIGVDAFLEHHDREATPPPVSAVASAHAASFEGGAPARVESDEIVELDWSELLEEGPDSPREPPPLPSETRPPPATTDDEFFAELNPGSLRVPPGDEAAAWGAAQSSAGGIGGLEPLVIDDDEPAADPLAMPIGHFSAPFRQPASADRGSVSKEIPVGTRLRRRTSGMEVLQRGRDEGPIPSASVEIEPESRDLTEMSDDSIDAMLDADFKAWDSDELFGDGAAADASAGADPSPPRRTPTAPPPVPPRGTPARPATAEAARAPSAAPPRVEPPRAAPTSGPPRPVTRPLASPPPRAVDPPTGARPQRGVVEAAPTPTSRPIPPSTGRPPAAAESTRPSSAPGAAVVPPMSVKPSKVSDLESIIRAGLADLEEINFEGTPPPEPPLRPPLEPPPPGTDLDALVATARRRKQAGDFSGSLELVEQVLLADPDHAEARAYMEENTDRLLAMYRSRIGALTQRPRVRMKPQQIIWQSLDHRAGYVMSQCDGMTSYQEIIDICGMPELETTRILARLVEQRVVG